MTRSTYLISLVVVVAIYVAWTGIRIGQPWDGPLPALVSTAILVVGTGCLTMVRKRSKQRDDSSRESESIERRASERASEGAFVMSLLVIAALMSFLSVREGWVGFLVGGGALTAAVGAFWILYYRALRASIRE